MPYIMKDGNKYSGYGGGGSNGEPEIVHCTKEEYDRLPNSKLTDNIVYMIEDENSNLNVADYEQGTFTLEINKLATTTMAYLDHVSLTANYTKIGRMCYISCSDSVDFTTEQTKDVEGYINIPYTTLPFVPKNSTNVLGVVGVNKMPINRTYDIACVVTNIASIVDLTTTTGFANLTIDMWYQISE